MCLKITKKFFFYDSARKPNPANKKKQMNVPIPNTDTQNGTKYNAQKNIKKGNNFQALLVAQTSALLLTIMTGMSAYLSPKPKD
jgi:hypothetical protein